MMDHHTKFDYKRSSGSDNIQILTEIWNLDLQHKNPIFSEDALADNDVPTKSGW